MVIIKKHQPNLLLAFKGRITLTSLDLSQNTLKNKSSLKLFTIKS